MSTNRAAILNKVHKVLKKHYKPVVPQERSVLEHLIYACCLENARFEAADEAFARLKELYIDWNEVRVTTATEISEGMQGIPDAVPAATRVKKSLQSVFESAYQFDLEKLKKQNLGQTEIDLEKIQGSSAFVRFYVIQNAIGGHAIAVNHGALEALFAVGAISDGEMDKGSVPGMERAIPKNKGVEFFSLLHQFGADFHASPGSQKLRGILAEIDEEYKERLARRQAQLEELAAQQRAAAAASRPKTIAKIEIKPPAPTKSTDSGAGKSAAPPAGKSTQATSGKPASTPSKSDAKEKSTKPTAESEKSRAKDKDEDKPAPRKRDEKSRGKPTSRTDSKGLTKKKPK